MSASDSGGNHINTVECRRCGWEGASNKLFIHLSECPGRSRSESDAAHKYDTRNDERRARQ